MNKLYILITASIIMLGASCKKLDNYPAPKSGIHGTLTDAETGGSLVLPQGEGSIRLLEQNPKYPNPSPIDLAINSKSAYYSTQLFADQYKVFPLALSGPFIYPAGDSVLVTLKAGSNTQVDFKIIPYYRIEASASDSTITYTITSSDANTAAGGHLTNVYFMLSADSALNMGTAGNLPGSYYANRFPLNGASDDILGTQQTFTIPFSTTHLPKGTYYLRVSCAGTESDGQYNYSQVVQATIN